MLVFPSMLCSAADAAGIKYPKNPDGKFDKNEFPHWFLLCATQLERPMVHGEHFENAVKIAKVTPEEIPHLTFEDCAKLGFYPEY